jgi:hypothetical protein
MSRSWLVVPLLMVASIAAAQTSAPSSTKADPQPEGKTLGSFVVHQSFEFGYRLTDVSGEELSPSGLSSVNSSPGPASQAMYGTLVNLQQGPRLLDQTFSMQAPDHNGVGFDDLSFSSFGFGGDPNDVARLRVTKYKWYDFSGLFRRDWNFWNYNLLANPLNPPTSNPTVPITDSPHAWNTSRRMTDLSLTLAPQSRISVRTGYSRNIVQGLSFTTIPEGTLGMGTIVESIETELAQHNRVLSEEYQAGIDFKVLPRTTISYDEFVVHTHNDNRWDLQNFPFVLPDGTPANLGISWSTTSATSPSPCPVPFPSGPPVADPTCSLFLAYNRTDHMRTNTPTEQLSFQSQFFRKVDLSGLASYSNLTLSGPFVEFFNGFLPDSNTRQSNTTGPMGGERITVNTDLNATVHVTNHLRVSDQFHFYSFRIPAFWNSFVSIWSNPGDVSALSPSGNPLPLPADSVDNALLLNFLGENTKSNEVQVHYDLKRGGAMLGYRYRHTLYHVSKLTNDLTMGTIDSTDDFVEVNSHSALAGVWIRPTNNVHASADLELTSADNFLTRISPRRLLHYTVRARYQPTRWMLVAAHADVRERRNGIVDIRYNAHNRNFGATVTLTKGDRLAWETTYNYNNVGSNAFICFQTVTVVPTDAVPCVNASDGAPLQLYGTYAERDHFASTTLMAKPIKRVTVRMGYSIVDANGDDTVLNPLQPFGSLKSNYHRPLADLEFEFTRGWTAIALWNYYDYSEKTAFFGPTDPRSFHANVTTLSLRYAF